MILLPSAVSSIFYSTVTFNFDLLTRLSDAFISVPQCFNAVRLVKTVMYITLDG